MGMHSLTEESKHVAELASNNGRHDAVDSGSDWIDPNYRPMSEAELEALLLESLKGEPIRLTPEWWEELKNDIIKRYSKSPHP